MSVLKYNNNGTWEGLNIDHASTADSALYDADGNVISSTYLPRSAGASNPLTGNLHIDSQATAESYLCMYANDAMRGQIWTSSSTGQYPSFHIGAFNGSTQKATILLNGNSGYMVLGAANDGIYFRPNGLNSSDVEACMGTGGRLIFSSDNSHYGGIDRVAGGTTVSYVRQTYSGYLDIWSRQATQIRVGAGNQESNTVRFLFGSNGVLTAPGMYTQTGSGSTLTIASDGQIKRTSSLRKYKKNIEDVTEEQANNGYGLRPITFESAIEGDREERQYGLIAEEVEEVVPELCTYDMEGNIDGVAYDRVCAILLKQNQMLKAQVDALEKRVEELERK